MIHLIAWYQSVDLAGVLTAINAVTDPVIATNGVDARVPDGLTALVAAAALVNDASFAQAQIQAPSLRSVLLKDVEPLVQAAKFGSYPKLQVLFDNPLTLNPTEAVNFALKADPAGAVDNYGLVWLADGPIQPAKGKIFTVNATSSVSLSAGKWVNGNLTFGQTLPTGKYQIVGMRARGSNLVAARLVFVGGTFRPGVPALNAVTDDDNPNFRQGYCGVFGEFSNITPPTVDCLGITDSAQSFQFDLIKSA